MSSEIESHIKVDIGSERSFGLVFGTVFALIGLYPLIHGESVRWWAIVIALAFFAVAFIWPQILKKPNLWWYKFGMLLGAIFAPIFMGLVFYVAVVPTGLIMRLIGKDLLSKKIDRQAPTYWLPRASSESSMKDQF